MNAYSKVSLLLGSFLVLGFACGDPKEDAPSRGAEGPLTVYVVNEPLRYFAQRLGGEGVRVVFPMKVDADPAFWTPDAETILAYQKAGLILRNGADYAKWIQKVSLPDSRVIDTSRGFHDRLIEIKASVTHQHGPSGKHSHSGHASTTWLDPLLALEQAVAVRDALQSRMPDQSQAIEKRFLDLSRDLKSLDAQIRGIVAQNPGLPILASHPVYQYLQRRYKLALRSVHWEPGEMPTADQWAEFEKILAEHPARSMLWESKPLQAVHDRLAKLGVRSLVYDPCATKPTGDDFLGRMRENIESLRKAWR